MIMNQKCHDEPNKKSHTNTPDHHRPNRNACNKSTVNDRNTNTGIFVQLPLFSSNVNVQHKNHHHHHHVQPRLQPPRDTIDRISLSWFVMAGTRV
jgi:hypothetical protein